MGEEQEDAMKNLLILVAIGFGLWWLSKKSRQGASAPAGKDMSDPRNR